MAGWQHPLGSSLWPLSAVKQNGKLISVYLPWCRSARALGGKTGPHIVGKLCADPPLNNSEAARKIKNYRPLFSKKRKRLRKFELFSSIIKSKNFEQTFVRLSSLAIVCGFRRE